LTGVGDFNDNGTSDVLWRSRDGQYVVAWFILNGRLDYCVGLGAP